MNMNGFNNTRPACRIMNKKNYKAFTLIELLVVIAIIALLLSILMPALQKVKAIAQSVVCRAHLKPCGIGLAAYGTDWEDFIPGPSTSGYELSMSGDYVANPISPVSNIDWISPILGDNLGFSSDRTEKIIQILNSGLKCAANKRKNDYFYSSGAELDVYPGTNIAANQVAYASFSSPMAFHLVREGNTRYPAAQSGHPLNSSWGYSESLPYFKLHKSYTPKLSKVGRPSSKVFVIEGARYYTASTGEVSFNDAEAQDSGGNWMMAGPFFSNSGDPMKINWTNHSDISTYTLDEATAELAFRHANKMDVMFFDGHADQLGLKDACNARLYLPKKTYITAYGANTLQDPNLGEGYID